MADGHSYYGKHFSYIQKKLFEQNLIKSFGNLILTPKYANFPIPVSSAVSTVPHNHLLRNLNPLRAKRVKVP